MSYICMYVGAWKRGGSLKVPLNEVSTCPSIATPVCLSVSLRLPHAVCQWVLVYTVGLLISKSWLSVLERWPCPIGFFWPYLEGWPSPLQLDLLLDLTIHLFYDNDPLCRKHIILVGTNLNSKEMSCPRCSHATLSADFRLDSMERVVGWVNDLFLVCESLSPSLLPFPLKSYPATQKKSSPSPVAEVWNAMRLLTNRNRMHACSLNIT